MTESVREKIYLSIRDDITHGKLAPGERLVEFKLAERFKASRSPIREAMRQLESEGLIQFEPNKGFTVSKLSPKELEEIYNLRSLLESYAARLGAERANKTQIKHLKEIHQELRTAARNSDVQGWIDNNILFHDFFLENSENGNLRQVVEMLKRRVNWYQYMIVLIPSHYKAYLEHHEAILKACETNEGGMAEKFMKLHIDAIKQVLLNHLSQFPAFR